MGCAASTTASSPAQQQQQQQPIGHQTIDVAAQQQPNSRPVAMNQLQRPPQPQQPPASRGSLREAPLIRSLVDLAREKCVIQNGEDGCFAKLTFSSLTTGEVIAYFNATEEVQADDGKTMPRLQASQVSRQQFSAGSSQVARLFLCKDVAAGLAGFTEDKSKHQVVVELKADSTDFRAITMQRSFLKLNSDSTSAQVTGQKVRCGTAVRTLQALYGTMPCPKDVGRSGMDSTSSLGNDAEGSECVICLSKPREVAILHCRHVCLCRSCATITSSTWSFQCPVCRGRVAAMVAVEGA